MIHTRTSRKKLGVAVHQIQVTPMDDDDFIGSVSMDVPPHREHPYVSRQEFFGEYTPWNEQAIETACAAALAYLKKVGVLVVDDANYADLKICQAQLKESQFWKEMFRERASAQQPNAPGSASHRVNIQAGQRVNTALANKSVVVAIPQIVDSLQVKQNLFRILYFKYTNDIVIPFNCC
jgi:hypothetical protein